MYVGIGRGTVRSVRIESSGGEWGVHRDRWSASISRRAWNGRKLALGVFDTRHQEMVLSRNYVQKKNIRAGR
jgi:hypothetical protein